MSVDFLLKEDIIALRKYIDFSAQLPEALQDIRNFSQIMERQRIKLEYQLDSTFIEKAAQKSFEAWSAIPLLIPAIAENFRLSAEIIYSFSDELYIFSQIPENTEKTNNRVDFKIFNSIKSSRTFENSISDIQTISRTFSQTLDNCISLTKNITLRNDIVLDSVPGFFSQYIDYLMLRLVLSPTEQHLIMLSSLYSLGHDLPGMRFSRTTSYSQQQRLHLATAYLRLLLEIRGSAYVAALHTSHFCHAVIYLAEDMKKTLSKIKNTDDLLITSNRFRKIRSTMSIVLSLTESTKSLNL